MKSKVFISWSGERSNAVALALREWLPDVVHNVDPFVSEEDIAKGSRGLDVIVSHLKEASVGVICLTPENATAPWILFEAGALSNSLGARNLVCPILLGLRKADVKSPLSQFQLTATGEHDIRRLVKTINESFYADYRAADEDLTRRFKRMWPELKETFEGLESSQSHAAEPPKRSTDEIVLEILEVVRQIERDRIPRANPIAQVDWDAIDSIEFEDDSSLGFVPGVKVEHATFGVGKIIEKKGLGDRISVLVFFPEIGQKWLKLKFARLQIVD